MQHNTVAKAEAGSLPEVGAIAGESGGATDLVGARWNVTCRAQNGATRTTEMLQHCFLLIRSNFARWLASIRRFCCNKSVPSPDFSGIKLYFSEISHTYEWD